MAQIKGKIKKSEEENNYIEINSGFPICGKPRPLYKGKLVLEKNKELEGLNIETLHVSKFYNANISMHESERVERDKEIIKSFKNYPLAVTIKSSIAKLKIFLL